MMKRYMTLAMAFMLLGLLGAVPAFAQENDLQPPYEDEEVLPQPPVETVTPEPVEEEDEVAAVPGPPAPAALPVTGLDVSVGALLAAVLLAGGGTALFVARRRSVEQ